MDETPEDAPQDWRTERDDLVAERAADPDAEIGEERMERGFTVAEAMMRERDDCERPESGPAEGRR